MNQLLKRFHLALTTLAMVAVLVVGKYVVQELQFEFLTLNALFTSGIAGTIFIIGFLLAGVFADYKEAEKVPAELCSSLKSLWEEAALFKRKSSEFDLEGMRGVLLSIAAKFSAGLSHEGGHHNLRPALDCVGRLNGSFAQMERLGMLPNYLVRLKTEHANVRRQVLRVYHIQRMQFIPSVFVLAESLAAFVVLLLFFTKTEGSPESFVLFAFIAYIFLYTVRLIRVLDRPFDKGHESQDDVSLFLIREFEEELRSGTDGPEGETPETAGHSIARSGRSASPVRDAVGGEALE